MKPRLHLFIPLAALLLALPSLASGQPSSTSSSLGSLDTNNLLGDSAVDKDFGKLPTNITSDTLTLNAKNRVFVYKGNVVVTQGDMKLTSKLIEGTYSEQNQIQKIVAKGDVVITKQDIKATSQLATYDAVSAIVTLTDNPQLIQGESALIADRIKVFLNENRSQAEGNVRVTFVKKDAPASAAAQPTAAAALPTPAQTPAATPTPAKTPSASSVKPKPSVKSTAKKPKKAAPKKKPAKK